MLSTESLQICDQASRTHGFDEVARKTDRDMLSTLSITVSEHAEKLHLKPSVDAMNIEASRNLVHYKIQVSFSQIDGSPSSSITQLQSAMRHVSLAKDGRVAVLESTQYEAKTNRFVCVFSVPSSGSLATRMKAVTIRKKPTSTSAPKSAIVKQQHYYGGARQQSHHIAKIEPNKIVEEDTRIATELDEESVNEAEAYEEQVVATVQHLPTKKRSWWSSLTSAFSRSSSDTNSKFTEQEKEIIGVLEFSPELLTTE